MGNPRIKSEIFLAGNGRKIEGIIDGTPKPGTIMQVKPGVAPVDGRLTYEVFDQTADGDKGLIFVLDVDHYQGKTVDDAYVSGTRGFLVCPVPGDELNVLVAAPGTGTGDSIDVGDKFIVDDGTGLLIEETGTPESVPFIAMEEVDDVVATGTLVQCYFTGY